MQANCYLTLLQKNFVFQIYSLHSTYKLDQLGAAQYCVRDFSESFSNQLYMLIKNSNSSNFAENRYTRKWTYEQKNLRRYNDDGTIFSKIGPKEKKFKLREYVKHKRLDLSLIIPTTVLTTKNGRVLCNVSSKEKLSLNPSIVT